MTEADPILDMLLGVEPMTFAPGRGKCAYRRADVEAAGGEHETVTAWVKQRGGRYVRPMIASPHPPSARLAGSYAPGDDYYAIPVDALVPSEAS
jgi:hypothetical protein